MQISRWFARKGLSALCQYLGKKPAHIGLAFLFVLNLGIRNSAAQDILALVGSGSTVPAPLINKWAEQFNKKNSRIKVRYLAFGAAEGVRQISHGSGDFAAGEVPLTAKERSDGDLVELPLALIAIVPIYNVPGVQGEVRFSGELLADIYLGRVKKWNSPAIAKLNPQLSFPDLPIKVVYRPAGKGSNYIFSEFLSKSSSQFREEVGTSASPKWPVGTPAERSADIAEKVKGEAGSIGYVETQYAIDTGVPYGSVLNSSGHFVKASGKTINAACRSVESPSWDRFSASLVNAPNADSYPVASFSWLYIKSKNEDSRRAAALADLLDWIYNDGQQIASQQGYAELPPQLLQKIKSKVGSLR